MLAILVAVTLCVVFFQHPAENPDIEKVLVYAFTSIIGFYFGTLTTTKGQDVGERPALTQINAQGIEQARQAAQSDAKKVVVRTRKPRVAEQTPPAELKAPALAPPGYYEQKHGE